MRLTSSLAELRGALRAAGARPRHEALMMRAWVRGLPLDALAQSEDSQFPRKLRAALPALSARFAGLVGVWKAVARRANGELTTVELHLDNGGWAELTVPGSDGKPSTTKSRVNVENDELKLKGSDKVVSLGKLLEFNSRQMVLERAEGRVTFVRL